ncbi:MAG: hypothetical protein JXN64_07890 [Spirochaetes bacterium]|nr:hypothetical protein [Spirochaetota bacterium]
MKHKIYYLIILFFFFNAVFAMAETKTVIVIPDVVTSGVNLSTGSSLTSFIVNEFVKSKKISVVDRKNIYKILQELQLQMTGLTNTDNAKKVGLMLNADKFVFVTVSRSGGISMIDSEEKFLVKLDITDIESGVIEDSHKDSVFGTDKIYEYLSKIISDILIKIPIKASVLSLNNNIVYLDAGTWQGIISNKKYKIKKITRMVRDSRGKIIFRKSEIVGDIIIIDVNEASSEAKIDLFQGVQLENGASFQLLEN